MSGATDRQPQPPSGLCSNCCSCFHACLSRDSKKKFAGVEYSLVPSTGEGMVIETIPMPEMKKSFSLPQGRTELAIPLQLDHQEWAGSKRAVTKQPKHTRSISEPSRPTVTFRTRQCSIWKTRREWDWGAFLKWEVPRQEIPRLLSLHSLPPCLPPPSLFPEGQTSHQPHQYHHEHEDSGSWKPSLSSIADADESEERRESGNERGGEGGGGRRGREKWVRKSQRFFRRSSFPLLWHTVSYSNSSLAVCTTIIRSEQEGRVSPIVLLYLLPNARIFSSRKWSKIR